MQKTNKTKRRREEAADREEGSRKEARGKTTEGLKNNQRYFWTRRLVFMSQLSLLNLTHSSGGALSPPPLTPPPPRSSFGSRTRGDNPAKQAIRRLPACVWATAEHVNIRRLLSLSACLIKGNVGAGDNLQVIICGR